MARLLHQTGRRVVVYLRKSPAARDAVEGSIDQQRKKVRELCQQNGWVIVDEYVDESRSGSRNQKLRKHFIRMIADIAAGLDVEAIVVWHTSRFSRLNSIKQGRTLEVLLDHNVSIETCVQGTINPATPEGRMALFLHGESDHAFVAAVSAGSIRGRDESVEAGKWPHGQVPYGYDRTYIDGSGKEIATISRTAKAEKARAWHVRLTVNEIEAAVVVYIFTAFVRRSVSRRQIVLDLNKRGDVPPTRSAAGWSLAAITQILRNPTYAGDVCGGYSRSHRTGEAMGRLSGKINRDACAKIVDRPLWEAAQEKLSRVKNTWQPRANRRMSALSGIIICGKCGKRMAYRCRSKKDTSFFSCNNQSARPGTGCGNWRITEQMAMAVVRQKLVFAIDGHILREVAKQKDDRRREAEIKAARTRVEKLQRDTRRGEENLLLADPDIFAGLQERLKAMQAELTAATNALSLLDAKEGGSTVDQFSSWWHEQRPTLLEVLPPEIIPVPEIVVEKDRHLLGLHAEPDVFRELLHRLNAKLICRWKRHSDGLHWTLLTGEIEAELNGELLDPVDALRRTP